ncbi:MoxR family ATPase [uncultured Dialister sp.]|jgi:MoxR-like ATPase|uniref:AAA family ATPase n=1 Tax=uncultured Dialister sp. TaxID=278064 RepID=UPI0026DD46C9|nr:MoxR family ATPase [uncultured Dialister sp.]
MNTKETIDAILSETGKAVLGKDEVLRRILTAILAGGHILIDDIPGVGKTTIAVAFTHVLGLDYKRMQFTPDVLPSDITGFSMYDKNSGTFRYMPGSAMTNFFLADEINRASPKTQSALLEVMQEGRLSVDGKTYAVPQPFIVMATQNPFGSSGTQELPESQTDRFMIRITVGYPEREDEIRILSGERKNPAEGLSSVITPEGLLALREEVSRIHVEESLYGYMVDIARATRNHPDIRLGVSPRGTMALSSMARAHALMEGRSYATPDDVAAVAPYTLGHRISLTGDARYAGKTAESVLTELLSSLPLPSLKEE